MICIHDRIYLPHIKVILRLVKPHEVSLTVWTLSQTDGIKPGKDSLLAIWLTAPKPNTCNAKKPLLWVDRTFRMMRIPLVRAVI